jgi:transcriptional regulator with XRE-family HTH domain
MRSFGEALRWARNERRMTLRQLGVKLGLSAPFLSDVEHDRRNLNQVADAEKVLGLRPGELELRGRMSPDLADWLSTQPRLIRLIRDVRACRCKPVVLKALRSYGDE